MIHYAIKCPNCDSDVWESRIFCGNCNAILKKEVRGSSLEGRAKKKASASTPDRKSRKKASEKARMDRMSTEDKARMKSLQKKWFANLSAEKKSEINARNATPDKRSAKSKRRLDGITPEKRAVEAAMSRDRWAKLPHDQKKKHNIRRYARTLDPIKAEAYLAKKRAEGLDI